MTSSSSPSLPVPSAAHHALDAYNNAFSELGLNWFWDDSTYRQLSSEPSDAARLRTYLRAQHPHLLKAYDADSLVGIIEHVKNRLEQRQ